MSVRAGCQCTSGSVSGSRSRGDGTANTGAPESPASRAKCALLLQGKMCMQACTVCSTEAMQLFVPCDEHFVHQHPPYTCLLNIYMQRARRCLPAVVVAAIETTTAVTRHHRYKHKQQKQPTRSSDETVAAGREPARHGAQAMAQTTHQQNCLPNRQHLGKRNLG